MTQDEINQLKKMFVQVFNDGCEQVIFPRLQNMQEEIEEKLGGKIVDSEKRIKKELREEFKSGQQSLSNRLEEVEVGTGQLNKKMDQVVKENKDYGKRLDKVEIIVKAN